ncbi:unnamed protein product [Trichobilharzia regenti]|nr:unnamed protein product [Trichobilharzia regenti]
MLTKERANQNKEKDNANNNTDNSEKSLHPKPGNRREEEALEAAERAKRHKQDGETICVFFFFSRNCWRLLLFVTIKCWCAGIRWFGHWSDHELTSFRGATIVKLSGTAGQLLFHP